jgi:YidC/Oxa1 family membrane protein insertase
MTPNARRIAIPLLIGLAAAGIALTMLLRPQRPAPNTTQPTAATAPATRPSADQSHAEASAAEAGVTFNKGEPATAAFVEGLRVRRVEPEDPNRPMQPLGTFEPVPPGDPAVMMRVDFAKHAAGIERITFSDFWNTATAKREAERARAGKGTMPAERERYVLQTSRPLHGVIVPLFAVHSIEVNGRLIGLFGEQWIESSAGKFYIDIDDAEGNHVLRVHRKFTLVPNSYEIIMRQGVDNYGVNNLRVRLIHYGPTDLASERGAYSETRRFRFGYLLNPERDPERRFIHSNRLTHDHGTLVSAFDSAMDPSVGDDDRAARLTLWPDREVRESRYELSWLGATSRYFTLAMHPLEKRSHGQITPNLSLADSVETVRYEIASVGDDERIVITGIDTPVKELIPGGHASFDAALYAGPLDRSILGEAEPYKSLSMDGLILYLMGSCFCNTLCTFPWLAHVLVYFLSFLHDYVLFDWGLAIIGLVLVVRTLLHPLTRRSQISMARVTKAMSGLKPEMDRLQERYKDEPAKLQQEMLALYREKGVNPVGCLGGFLPMFLQMPIWIALYATLYFAFELRHQPAFFGVFQMINGWAFLGDLASSDHFFGELKEPWQFGWWNLTGFNLIPILMGAVFFLQQKFMTPPTTAPLTPEQQAQQRMMKIMTVVLFPVMLYTAPSGLTLYIMTSSLIGILESWHIRKHIKHLELNPPKPKERRKPDRLGKLYAEAIERARQKAQNKRSFKSRD